MSASIDIQNACPAASLPSAALFRQWALAALGEHGERSEMTIRIVDEAESARLNETWRGKSGPTNVLSFPVELPEALREELPLLGDLIICAPVVEREAVQQGKSSLAHWAHMVVHGTLHLLGHDHQHDAEAAIMEARETELLAALDFPNPYTETPADTAGMNTRPR